MPKRTSEELENAEVKHTIDKPDPTKKKQKPIQKHFATSDAIVQSLASRTVLGHAMMWDYATHSNYEDFSREVLEGAITPIGDLNYNTKGEARLQSVPDMIRTFWRLHSQYIAPNGMQVHAIYDDVLKHVISLLQQYGDDFLVKGSKPEQYFVEALARESVPADESEKVADNGIIGVLQAYLQKNGLVVLIDEWLDKWANVPKRHGQLKHRVNMDLNSNVYFKLDGVLNHSIRLISEFIERLRHPPNNPKDNTDNLRKFIDWQMQYQNAFKVFPTCILLAVPCVLPVQSVTQLRPDFWENNGIQMILKQMSKEVKHPAADIISALFIYSGIDPSNGIDAMLELQKNMLHGADKNSDDLSNYEIVLTEHTRMRGAPWRTKNTAWPEDSVMEDRNYAYVKMIVEAARIPTKAIVEESIPAGGKKRAATVLETEKLVPPTSKKQKVTEKPKEEETIEEETIEIEKEGTNLPLIGGIAAISAGIAAVYFARRK